MEVYCTTKNSGPSTVHEDYYMIYLGTDLKEAIEVVGDFQRYERGEKFFPKSQFFTALPYAIEFEMVRYYMADGWWYTVVKFELEETNEKESTSPQGSTAGESQRTSEGS
jgi:hypothetical protein